MAITKLFGSNIFIAATFTSSNVTALISSIICEEISVETRTPNKAEFSYPDKLFTKFNAIPRKKIDEVLSHRGTQITIRNLKIQLDIPYCHLKNMMFV